MRAHPQDARIGGGAKDQVECLPIGHGIGSLHLSQVILEVGHEALTRQQGAGEEAMSLKEGSNLLGAHTVATGKTSRQVIDEHPELQQLSHEIWVREMVALVRRGD